MLCLPRTCFYGNMHGGEWPCVARWKVPELETFLFSLLQDLKLLFVCCGDLVN